MNFEDSAGYNLLFMPFFLSFHAALLTTAALIAGGINAIAGGGSLLSFPALLQAGVLPVHANATNTVALLPGQFTSAAAYRDEIKRYRSLLPPLLIAAFAGGLLGARVLMATRQSTFQQMVPWLLLTATVLFATSAPIQRRFLMHRHPKHATGMRPAVRVLLPFGIFCVCLYVGFFGAGSGLLIMAVLSFSGVESVHEINALKTIITSISNTVAAVTFMIYGAVIWHYCMLMMIAASIGGYGTAKYAQKHKPQGIRTMVVVMGCIVSAYYFWKTFR